MVGNRKISIGIILLSLIFLPSNIQADTNSNQAQILIQEVNGTNAGRYRVLIFPNGSTTNNGDGSITINFGSVPVTSNLTFLGINLQFNGSVLTFLGN